LNGSDLTFSGGPPIRVYTTALGYKVLVAAVTIVGLAFFLMILGTSFSRSAPHGRDLTVAYALLVAGSAMIACLAYVLASTFRTRLEIYSDRIRYIRLLGTKELRINAIRGFRMDTTRNREALTLVPKDPAVRSIRIALTIGDKKDFVEWAGRRLTNLDETEFQEEMKTALDDAALGSSEEERALALRRAKRWATCLSVVGTGIALWAYIKPTPYEYAIGALIVLPPAALVSLRFFRGALRFHWKARSPYSGIAPALCTSCGALALRAFQDWNILEWDNFGYPFIAVFLGMCFLAIMHAGDTWRKIPTAFLLFGVCAAYGYGTTISVNGLLDASAPVPYQARVLSARGCTGKSSSYHLKLSPWGPRKQAKEIEVSRTVYRRYKTGDSVQVKVRSGRLGIPWFEVH